MKFTIPLAALPYEAPSIGEMIESIRLFDDVKVNNQVIFSLVTASREVFDAYENLSEELRERYYNFYWQPSNREELMNETAVFAIGNNFTRKFPINPLQGDIQGQLMEAYY
jgi:hypothetical protein